MFPFKPALNTSTLIPFGLGVKEQIHTAAKAGYEGIELWVKDIESYVSEGGSLSGLKQYITDTGIEVVNAIAFWAWADRDPEARRQGLEQAKQELEMLAAIGCQAAAAPPYGEVEGVPLDEMAEAYAVLAAAARSHGVEPYLEFWGRAKQLYHIMDALYVAKASGVEEPKILLDPFHMYTGGSEISSLARIAGERIGIVHVNDYPSFPPQTYIRDSDRVFPGDGLLPSYAFASQLHQSGYEGYLSLELFRSEYGDRSALETASYGLAKMRKAYSL
ncbi:sugar phosphate isomerase/epimerase family protein [Paenibacillus sp. JX-17]|uniref:Sugar phosphate isomerase/epimerase family protein n=1 Tax=Paenibacillus lacisoli TaxID=3064525 RepID=A0ABT9CDP3_9BACL|nr:sugar phosphate isomerase/epimerase family protein [Paenibacillus sp. JX-17]MDO7906698.1 sugar phosphate isomerase/epimerase family protein [Paenibacillus sp. JX-17]